MKWMKIVLATAFLACATLAPVAVAGPEGHEVTRVKALVIGLTDDEAIGKGVAANLRDVERYLRGLPGFDATADLRELKGEDVTAESILQAVAEMEVEPTDTVFCYYAGHGAYDSRLAAGDPAKGHHFQLPGGDLMRATLLARLQAKGGRLTVLITDACNVQSKFIPPDTGSGFAAAGLEPVPSKALANLLFHYAGLVDVNGSSQGQFGFYDGYGWFTLGLLRALERLDESPEDLSILLQGGDVFAPLEIDWKQFLEGASDSVHAIFAEKKKKYLADPGRTDREVIRHLSDQADQRPQVFQLGVRRIERSAEDSDDFVPPLPPDWEKLFKRTPGKGSPPTVGAAHVSKRARLVGSKSA